MPSVRDTEFNSFIAMDQSSERMEMNDTTSKANFRSKD